MDNLTYLFSADIFIGAAPSVPGHGGRRCHHCERSGYQPGIEGDALGAFSGVLGIH